MLRKMLCAGFLLAVGVGVTLADEFGASIRKVEDGKVTFVKYAKGQKGQKGGGEPTTLPVAADVKVVSAKFNKETKTVEAGEALSGGLKNEKFTTMSDKGVRAHLITSDDGKTITEIRVMASGRKKKGA